MLRWLTKFTSTPLEAACEAVRFWGSPHQPWFFDWAFNHPRKGPALAHYWSLIPDDTDVLITHGPPYGILDPPFGKGEPSGCELLLKRVQEIEPRVHVFGHIHGSYGKKQVGGTLFVNACLCDERYEPVNPPQVIDLWPDGKVFGFRDRVAFPH